MWRARCISPNLVTYIIFCVTLLQVVDRVFDKYWQTNPARIAGSLAWSWSCRYLSNTLSTTDVQLKNIPRAEEELQTAHGLAVKNNKSRAKQQPRLTHSHAVTKNKPPMEKEPRSAHGRAVKN